MSTNRTQAEEQRCERCEGEEEPCHHCRTGEPLGAGEDCFERAMRAQYPERSE